MIRGASRAGGGSNLDSLHRGGLAVDSWGVTLMIGLRWQPSTGKPILPKATQQHFLPIRAFHASRQFSFSSSDSSSDFSFSSSDIWPILLRSTSCQFAQSLSLWWFLFPYSASLISIDYGPTALSCPFPKNAAGKSGMGRGGSEHRYGSTRETSSPKPPWLGRAPSFQALRWIPQHYRHPTSRASLGVPTSTPQRNC